MCFQPMVVNVIECSCWVFLHRALCLGKVQCYSMDSQDMLTWETEQEQGICVLCACMLMEVKNKTLIQPKHTYSYTLRLSGLVGVIHE